MCGVDRDPKPQVLAPARTDTCHVHLSHSPLVGPGYWHPRAIRRRNSARRRSSGRPEPGRPVLRLLDNEDIPALENVPNLIATAHQICGKLDGGTSVGDLVGMMRINAYETDPTEQQYPPPPPRARHAHHQPVHHCGSSGLLPVRSTENSLRPGLSHAGIESTDAQGRDRHAQHVGRDRHAGGVAGTDGHRCEAARLADRNASPGRHRAQPAGDSRTTTAGADRDTTPADRGTASTNTIAASTNAGAASTNADAASAHTGPASTNTGPASTNAGAPVTNTGAACCCSPAGGSCRQWRHRWWRRHRRWGRRRCRPWRQRRWRVRSRPRRHSCRRALSGSHRETRTEPSPGRR